MKRPLIGLTMDSTERPERYGLNHTYPLSIEKAGGIPIPLPYRTSRELIPELLDRLDGILLIGGDDMDPKYWGEAWHPKAIQTDPLRIEFELALLAELERRRMPVLGICLGCQVMNVYRGGSLHQFLPELDREEALEHRRLDLDVRLHPVKLEPQSLIGRRIGQREILVNTFHKQGINRLGRDLRVSAVAPDGIIEGIEDPALPLFAGVQWHPEKMHTQKEHLALFELLVEKAVDGG